MTVNKIKKFKEVCSKIRPFVEKFDSASVFHNKFFLDGNIMRATNGKIIVSRDCSDCLSNEGRTILPSDIDSKVKKEVFNEHGVLWIDGKEMNLIDNYDDAVKINFDKVIPNDKILKIQAKREYDLEGYGMVDCKPKKDERPIAIFTDKELVFDYDDYCEMKAYYPNSSVEDMFGRDGEFKEMRFPLWQITSMLKIGLNFLAVQYKDEKAWTPMKIFNKDYEIVISPMKC